MIDAPPTPPPELVDFISLLERALGRVVSKKFEPLQPGDVEATAADATALEAWVGFRPATSLAEGVERFSGWYGTYAGTSIST